MIPDKIQKLLVNIEKVPEGGNITSCKIRNKNNDRHNLNAQYFNRTTNRSDLGIIVDQFYFHQSEMDTCSFNIHNVNYDFLDTWYVITDYVDRDGVSQSIVDSITIILSVNIMETNTIWAKVDQPLIVQAKFNKSKHDSCYLTYSESIHNKEYFSSTRNFQLQKHYPCSFKIKSVKENYMGYWKLRRTYKVDNRSYGSDIMIFDIQKVG